MGILAAMLVFIGVLSVGFTTLGMINPGRLLQRDPGKNHKHAPHRIEVDLSEFNQFEIEGAELVWPSMIRREASAFRPLPWPSTTWDDAHFGKALGGANMDIAEVPVEAPMATLSREDGLRGKAEAESRKVASRARKEAQRVRERAEDDFFEAVDQGRKAVSNNLGFDPADVPDMVREYGLAGAVERIRKQTGWDFKDAAQFVAKALRN